MASALGRRTGGAAVRLLGELVGCAAVANRTGQTVYIPRSNILCVEGLRQIARVLGEEELVYAG